MLMPCFPECSPVVSFCIFSYVMVFVEDCVYIECDVGCFGLWVGDGIVGGCVVGDDEDDKVMAAACS